MRKCDFNKAALQEAFDVINHNILLKKKCFRLDFLFDQLHGLDRTSLIENVKPI